tara:strand:- start:8172 stop:8918 length:747 start_codon:yes stop_codon:yes gene_type:complete
MAEPLVSIIMPAYNSEKYIAKSIESVIAQTYKNWELLITDDRSSDSTQKIVKEYCATDERVKLFVNKENGGAGAARNNSITHAKGRYIAFLDSDDLWHPAKLEKQITFMLEHNYGLTYTSYQKFTGNSYLGVVTPPLSTNYSKLLSSNVIGCLTAIYDTEIVGKQFMPLIRKRQDMGLWLQILKKIPEAHCLQVVLGYYRKDSGMTRNKFEVLKWQWRFYREELCFGLVKSLKFFSMYVYNSSKKYLR